MSINGLPRSTAPWLNGITDVNGPGVLCQMRIIQEIMNRHAFDLNVDVDTLYPGDHMDVIGGVDFGW